MTSTTTKRKPMSARSQTQAAKRARQTYQSRKRFGCPECAQVFSCVYNVEQHVRSKHTGERPFTCHCGKGYGRNWLLLRHQRSAHGYTDNDPQQAFRPVGPTGTRTRSSRHNSGHDDVHDEASEDSDSSLSDVFSDSETDPEGGDDDDAGESDIELEDEQELAHEHHRPHGETRDMVTASDRPAYFSTGPPAISTPPSPSPRQPRPENPPHSTSDSIPPTRRRARPPPPLPTILEQVSALPTSSVRKTLIGAAVRNLHAHGSQYKSYIPALDLLHMVPKRRLLCRACDLIFDHLDGILIHRHMLHGEPASVACGCEWCSAQLSELGSDRFGMGGDGHDDELNLDLDLDLDMDMGMSTGMGMGMGMDMDMDMDMDVGLDMDIGEDPTMDPPHIGLDLSRDMGAADGRGSMGEGHAHGRVGPLDHGHGHGHGPEYGR